MMQSDPFLKAHLEDLRMRAQKSGLCRYSDFLEPVTAKSLKRQYPHEVVLYGGYEDAERKMACFLGERQDSPNFPFVCLFLSFKNKNAEASHRDCLGALMHLGLERSCFGDIVKTDGGFFVFVTEAAERYVLASFDQIGREPVKVARAPEGFSVPKRQYREEKKTVASNRLDCITAAFMKKSRGDATDALRAERVFLNYVPEKSPDTKVHDGDVLSVRGVGKAKVFLTGETSKKGRLLLTLWVYR